MMAFIMLLICTTHHLSTQVVYGFYLCTTKGTTNSSMSAEDDIGVNRSWVQEGLTTAEHKRHVWHMFNCAWATGLKLNHMKFKIGLTEVPYAGHMISKERLKLSPDRVKSILDMPSPTCKEDVKQFNAMVGYLQKFLLNMLAEIKALRELTANKVAWHCDERHDAAFTRFKKLIASASVLKLCDMMKPVVIQVEQIRARSCHESRATPNGIWLKSA